MEKEIHLIEKRRKGLLSLIFSRTGVIIILFALAVLTALSVMNWFAGLIAHISAGIILFNVIVIVYSERCFISLRDRRLGALL